MCGIASLGGARLGGRWGVHAVEKGCIGKCTACNSFYLSTLHSKLLNYYMFI